MTRPNCPICGAPVHPAYRPFCSKRCADVDLGRWLTGVYAAPAEEEDPPGVDDYASPPLNGGAQLSNGRESG